MRLWIILFVAAALGLLAGCSDPGFAPPRGSLCSHVTSSFHYGIAEGAGIIKASSGPPVVTLKVNEKAWNGLAFEEMIDVATNASCRAAGAGNYPEKLVVVAQDGSLLAELSKADLQAFDSNRAE